MDKNTTNSPLWTDNEWTFERLADTWKEIEIIAKEEFNLDYYEPQIEIITAEQMIDNYSSHGLPSMYNHWSFGKKFISDFKGYKAGMTNLAYEIIINSSPAIAYLMEENTMTMQALVMAHASVGHSAFFKNNYLFRMWTDPEFIIDYLIFAKEYISECEEKYGYDKVEELIDSLHALMYFGVDKYKKPKKKSKENERERQKIRLDYRQKQLDDLWKTIPRNKEEEDKTKKKMLPEPQENLLYFIEKNSPVLEEWQREIVRIIRKTSQYFWPQMQTQVSNEGTATFWHYTIMNRLHDKGLITEGAMLEFLQSHTNVVMQLHWDHKHYSQINPYYLGFNIYRDIRRICEKPTEEDKRWFPNLIGKNWIDEVKYAMTEFKDNSFILQYLSPKVIRDLKFFIIDDEEDNEKEYVVDDIHNDVGYQAIREQLAAQYDINEKLPNIQIVDVDLKGDRLLTLHHFRHNNIPLDENSTIETLKHLHRLWGFDILLESVNEDKVIENYKCTEKSIKKEK
jgi:stage V sporulation protein R